MWFGNSQEYFGMSFVDLLLSWAFELRKVQVISCHPGSFKGIAKACCKKNVANMPFLVTSFELRHGCFTPSHPFTCGTRCNMMLVNFPATARSPSTWRRWNNMGVFSFVSAIVMVFNSQLSDFNSLYSLRSYLLLPLSPKNGLATLLSVPPVLNGSETLQHVPWQLLLLLPDQWISPKRLTPFMMLSTHCTHCKPPPPPTTAATMIKIIW